MLQSARFAVVAAVIAAVIGCSGGRTFQYTDVTVVPDFEETMASNIQHGPNNMLLSGTLQYEGQGDLKLVFHSYIESLVNNGWTAVSQDSSGEKATASLRKDNRTCTLEFSGTAGQVKAVIKVGPSIK